MTLLLIIAFGYFAVGVAYASFSLSEDKKKGKVDPNTAMTDPDMFWLFIVFWPIVACIRFLSVDDGEK